MNSRGPPEGAPGDSLEMPIIDKSSEISENWPPSHLITSASVDQSRKTTNNRLLFLTVSYDFATNRNSVNNKQFIMLCPLIPGRVRRRAIERLL